MSQPRGPFGGSAPAKGSSWGALARLVWGDVSTKRLTCDDNLSRRRRDLHPDAPPRAPLFASRDLPVPDSAAIDARRSGRLRPTYLLQAVALARATSRPQPAPARTPEPMSDDEIIRILASTPRRSPAPESANAALVKSMKLPLIEGADLAALATRFERSLTLRETAIKAAECRQAPADRLPHPDAPALQMLPTPPSSASPIGTTAEAEANPDAPPPIQPHDALSQALATLRALAAQGRR